MSLGYFSSAAAARAGSRKAGWKRYRHDYKKAIDTKGRFHHLIAPDGQGRPHSNDWYWLAQDEWVNGMKPDGGWVVVVLDDVGWRDQIIAVDRVVGPYQSEFDAKQAAKKLEGAQPRMHAFDVYRMEEA